MFSESAFSGSFFRLLVFHPKASAAPSSAVLLYLDPTIF